MMRHRRWVWMGSVVLRRPAYPEFCGIALRSPARRATAERRDAWRRFEIVVALQARVTWAARGALRRLEVVSQGTAWSKATHGPHFELDRKSPLTHHWTENV